MKKYGIFIAYAPTIDLRTEGLGRYLSSFLKAATARGDAHFVILCPSWSRDALAALCIEAEIPRQAHSFLGPDQTPLLYRVYQLLQRRRRIKQRRRRFQTVRDRLYAATFAHAEWLRDRIASTRSFTAMAAFAFYCGSMAIPLAALVLGTRLVKRSRSLTGYWLKQAGRSAWQSVISISRVSPSSLRLKLYEGMLERETALMIQSGNKQSDISAWYTPAAFWPRVADLKAPVLTCVPDVVLAEFPVGFAKLGGVPMQHAYQTVARTIRQGKNFVTYSDHIKRGILVERFGVDPAAIQTIPHAPNDLSRPISIAGFPDNEATARAYAETLLLGAIRKASNQRYASTFSNPKVKFIFYASQFRPSKNVITLLRAYEWLLRKRRMGHKLILTGFSHYESVRVFLREHNLLADVLCVHGLTEPELAACYKMADLAVSPSLSEGGMPFTFTEALSVETPAILADIDVTREIIKDPALREASLFDPYDWQGLGEKMAWAIQNRASLYQLQRRFYDEVLAKRSWANVVEEHLELLDQLAARQMVAAR
ncbi:glycosyltransferase [Mesorhizobium sp. M1C.F.Ca.ET.193.01.1.1]|uniref:glycosyltransferase n=2 Tax=Mesorhizobium TaxID=68287 RepID=UPI000FD42FD9|nr:MULTISPECIES: glycosyltransferase [unclassified Mesorhizobium]TGS93438.1 glycosyltransferase [bacterium M00.F.Ca.ET.177.01.1.1]TGQ50726.1 glycosyltransferase [Mesorhizobium sp. M1C.F.Ca.ET.210.01.1.1]TGQ65893.1 glycosyltransferase [Mesorhizobium sp. M1C.F.Ca.ET.212.01.1.1]TGQ99897.1 glycosyltransferase [Mesorhizobium sp. M1C.F.Ca.ET.204.01.1.1]TGR20431.1 glycosyltransferase [Mesorhizobium sp. M1C.F.Ca.ET.196.01.1.1]